MKKLLLPLIILLLIIGYFMSRSDDHKAKDAYDSLDKPDTEQMEDTRPPGSGTSPQDMETPPNGMDTDPREPNRPDTVPPNSNRDTLMHKAEDAAKDVGGAVGDAAKKAGDAVKEAGEDAREAADKAADKLRGEDSDDKDEPQN